MIFDKFQVYINLANFYLEAGDDEQANALLRKALLELMAEPASQANDEMNALRDLMESASEEHAGESNEPPG